MSINISKFTADKAVHCKTFDEAKQLFESMGWLTNSDSHLHRCWNTYQEKTCFVKNSAIDWDFTHIKGIEENEYYELIEFFDLVQED